MWAQIINTALGLWLMISPAIFGYGGRAADNAHIVGPLIATFSISAMWECTRLLRKWNYVPAIWLLLAPWVFYYGHNLALTNDTACGILVIIFSSFKGKTDTRFGGGWASLWKRGSLHEQEANNE